MKDDRPNLKYLLGVLRNTPRRLKALFALLSAAVVLITGLITVYQFFWEDKNEGSGNLGDGFENPPTPTLDPGRLSRLPDFLLSPVDSCQLAPPDGEYPAEVISLLHLEFKIINTGRHSFRPNDVYIAADSGLALEAVPRSTYLDDESWYYDNDILQEWVSDGNVDLPLVLTDLGGEYLITISVDHTGTGTGSGVVEGNESNNDTFVSVRLPQTLPDNKYEPVRCSPIAPA